MARDLKADQEILQSVLDFAQRRDFARAATLAEQTLASGLEHPLLLNVLATQREQEGRFDESLLLLERAVALSPGDIPARNALALCLQRLDRPAEALVHLDELLRLNPALGFAHASRGNALIAVGSLGSARDSHLRALQYDPNNLVAVAALAAIATHRGEHGEARQWAERALKMASGYPDAVLSLAAAELADGAHARAAELLHKLILDSRAGQIDRARATGLLGDVLDATGRYPEAYDAYVTCNDSLRQIHSRFAAGSSVRAYAQTLINALTNLESAPKQAPGATGAVPDGILGHAFLIGFPRSGTTLLEVVLDGHPQVTSLEENELLTAGVLRYMDEPVDLAPLASAPETALEPVRAAYWDAVRAAGVDVRGKLFLDKHPLNTLKLPLIARMFPQARILYAIRDPRAVVFSCFRRRFRMNPAMYQLLTLPGAAAFYDTVQRFAELAHARLPLAWRDVRYESLVDDLAHEVREICAFLGLDPAAGLEDFARHARTREHATPSTAQLAGGLNRSGLDQWQHYRQALEQVAPTLGPWVAKFKYGG